MANLRVSRELKKMENDGNPDIGILWKGKDLRNFVCFIRGPEATVYEGAFFKVHCHVPDRYPFEPLKMDFMTKIWHPNISSVTGAICLDILKDKWTPAMNIMIALLSIQALLTAAEPTDPQDHVVAEQYMQDHSGYERKARQWVKEYAQEGMITEKEELIQKWVSKGKNEDYVHTTNNYMELVMEQPSLGRVGFHNEGNSCFLNAACQCLFHLPELTLLLITSRVKNQGTSISDRSDLIEVLADILNETFQTTNQAIYTSPVFIALNSIAPYLCDGMQHDSHEVIGILLQHIEDELRESVSNGSPIDNMYTNATLSDYQRWWAHYKRYNPTGITPTFYGYSVTQNLCPHCGTRTSLLSAFNTLYICLPLTHYRISVNVVRQHLDLATGAVSLRTDPLPVKVDPEASLADVKEAVILALGGEIDVHLLLGTYELQSKAIIHYAFAELSLPALSLQSDGVHNFFLLAYPVPKALSTSNLMLLSIVTYGNRVNYDVVPFLFSFYRPKPRQIIARLALFSRGIVEGNQFHEDAENNGFFCDCPEGDEELLFDAFSHLEPTSPLPQSVFLDWNIIGTGSTLISYNMVIRPVAIRKAVRDGFSLEDGFEIETSGLNEHNLEECRNCGNLVDFSQSVRYGSLPAILTIQLKRFDVSFSTIEVEKEGKIETETRYVRRKINDLVEFPISGLDLSCVTEDHSYAVYDLVCVCNHSGTADSGHYYAYCCDMYDGERKWFAYNDDIVKPLKEEEVVTCDAYILFYRRRDCRDDVYEEIVNAIEPLPLNPDPATNRNEEDSESSGKSFSAYSAPSTVGSVSSSVCIEDIQGYKTVGGKNLSRRNRMSQWRKSSHSLDKTERLSLRTGEVVEKSELDESKISKFCKDKKKVRNTILSFFGGVLLLWILVLTCIFCWKEVLYQWFIITKGPCILQLELKSNKLISASVL